ncbi:MAG: glycosyltransferase [Saprospiraceae bacterium]|nr:glycosyltransferase [Saprospiraceae bacterium]
MHFKSPYVCKNMGVKLARGQFLVFLDASLLPGKDWLNPGLNKLRSNPNAIIIGNTVSSFDSRHPTAYELLDSLYLSPLDLANESSGTPGGNVFLSMETWKLVGEFMEVRSLGDIEWSARALNSGIKLVPEKDAIVYYTPKMKTSFIKKAIRMGKGRKALILSQKKNAMPLLVLFMFRQFLPPNPFTLYSTIQARNRAEYKGRFFEMYLVAWHFKLSYLRGIFTSNAYNQSTDL